MADLTCKEIFEGMPGRFKADGAEGWDAVIQFDISGDDGGKWVLTVDDGDCDVEEGETDDPSATVKTSAENWVGMADGSKNPMMLFTTGQLKVEGNIGDVMKLQSPAVFEQLG